MSDLASERRVPVLEGFLDTSDASVREIAQALLGTVSHLPCQRVTEGGEHQAWYVGLDFVLRGEKADGDITKVVEAVEREKELIGLLRNSSEDLYRTIPEVIAFCITSSGYVFSLQSRIHGASLEASMPTSRTEHDLVKLFRDLDLVSYDETSHMGLCERPPENLPELLEAAYRSWQSLVEFEDVNVSEQQMKVLLEANLSGITDTGHGDVSVPPHRLRVIHGDLKGEHILVDPSSGALQGVIDWSDASIGDPAVDIAGLAISVGQAMAQRIGVALGESRSLLECAKILSRCHAIILLKERLHGADKDSPVGLLKRQFCRAFEGTVAVDTLAK